MLVHSRKQLLNNFGPQLHTVAKDALEALGVELYLGERVVAGLDGPGSTEVHLQSGKVLHCDTLVSGLIEGTKVLLTEDSADPMYGPNSKLLSRQGRLPIVDIPFTIRASREDPANQGCTSYDIRVWRCNRS